MFARFASIVALTALLVGAGDFQYSSSVTASLYSLIRMFCQSVPAHLAARQTGDLQCNINRVNFLGLTFQALVVARNLTQQLAS